MTISFNGAHIRASGAVDSYTVSRALSDHTGSTIASTSFDGSPGAPETFQGSPVAIQGIADQRADTDATPGFEQLRITLNVKPIAAAPLSVDGRLFGGDTEPGTVQRAVQLPAGSHQLDRDFTGETIAGSRIDGPYTVYRTIHDST